MVPQDQLSGQIEIFHTISTICLVIFIIFLLFSIFLFIRLEIWKVIGFLSGKTQRKAVEKMIAGETSVSTASASGKKKKKNGKQKNISKKAVADSIMTPSGQLKKPGSDEVMLSTGSDITDLLGENAKTEERIVEEKVVFKQPPAPPVNTSDDSLESRKMKKQIGTFVVERSIILIHTEEKIA